MVAYVAAYLLICAIKENEFGLQNKVELHSKLQVHYYCFVLAFVCVDYSHRDICTYTGVEAIVPLGGGEDNATKVYALVLQTALAEKCRNYFFTYRAAQVSPAASWAVAENEVAAIGEGRDPHRIAL